MFFFVYFSLTLSFWNFFSVFLSLYLSPFPTAKSNTNNVCRFCGPFSFPHDNTSLCGTIRYRYSLISCLFIFQENLYFGTLAVWLMSSLWTEWNLSLTVHCTLHSVLSLQRHSLKRFCKDLTMLYPPDGWTQSQAIQIHFSLDPRYQHFQNCAYMTHRSPCHFSG